MPSTEADGGEVVGERVEPHVGDVVRVPRERDAPLERGAADREVAQAAADQAERLVAAVLGRHRGRVFGVPVEEPVLEAAEAEEVVLLLEVLDRALVDRAPSSPVDQFVVGVVLLAGDAVLAGERVELDVAGVVAALQQLGDGALWRGSVVRMKSSLAMFERSQAAANFGAIVSLNSCGVTPAPRPPAGS